MAADAAVQEDAAVAAGGARHVLADAVGGRVVSMSASMSWQMWLIMVKRNIARLVPLMKNADAAPRVVIRPAVAAAGSP